MVRNPAISSFVICLQIVFGALGQTSQSLHPEVSTLFQSGDGNYACYRIPSIVVANNGSILAFCEARKTSCSDTGDIDLVMKRSTDNGQTWSQMEVLWDDDKNVCGNPSPVVDRETGNIHLLLTWNNGEDHESEIIDGTSIGGREIYHMVSEDAGENWSAPRNISTAVKLPHWTWYATGPVHGIQLETSEFKGRLIVPCDHIERESKKYYSHIIYSDDNGRSWQLGGTTPRNQVNECSVAELANGDLILNMRNYARKEDQVRQVAISKDGGKSWIDQRFDFQLPEPRCQGALLNINRQGKNLLLFTNPADKNKRVNMTLSVSTDEGRSWNNKISIYRSHSAYSDLAQLSNGDIIVLFEAGVESPYEGIHYRVIPADRIINK